LRLKIENYCIRCGICITLYPEFFEMDFGEDIVRTKIGEIPETAIEKARKSIKDCAVTAIRLEK
jgi:ferredoxin